MNENYNQNQNTSADDVCDHIPEDAKDINHQEGGFSFSSLPQPTTGTAVASLVLGIFSVLCCCTNIPSLIMAVAGLVLGIYSYKKDPFSRTLSILGIILSCIGLGLAAIIGIIAGATSLLGLISSNLYF